MCPWERHTYSCENIFLNKKISVNVEYQGKIVLLCVVKPAQLCPFADEIKFNLQKII